MTTDELKKLVETTTPEGWHVYGRDGCAHLLFIGGPRGRQLPVAQIEPIPRKYQGTESQLDNARLIAAAPALAREVIALMEAAKDAAEMLALCRDMQAQVAHPEDPLLSQTNTALATLRAVLGESE
jgi:hypothetical protein